MGDENKQPIMPYDWRKVVTINSKVSEENRLAIETVLDDMAKHPAGRKVFEKLELVGEKVDIHSNENFRKGFFDSYSSSFTVKYKNLINVDSDHYEILSVFYNKKKLDDLCLNKTNLINISFNQLKNSIRIDENTSKLYPITLNYVIAHELEHCVQESIVDKINIIDTRIKKLTDIIDDQQNSLYNLLIPLYDELYSKRIIKRCEKEIEKLSKEKGLFNYKDFTYKSERGADDFAESYCENEPKRNSYLLILKLEEPLSEAIYYKDGETKIDLWEKLISEKIGQPYANGQVNAFNEVTQDIEKFKIGFEEEKDIKFCDDLDLSLKALKGIKLSDELENNNLSNSYNIMHKKELFIKGMLKKK